ncbi:MAG: hypothetical protein PVJ66_09245 [Gammaproteobacteria bacterium]|jgi:hypothetical protein
MLNRYTLTGLAVLFVLAVLFLMHESDEERVLERLEEIRALSEILSPESGIEPLNKARQIGRYFSEQTVFDLTHAGYGIIETGSRDDLVRRILRGRARLAALELELQDAAVHVEDDRARVRLLGSALGRLRGEQEPFLEIHSVEVRLHREGDSWLVTGARHLRDERQP